MTSKPSMLKIMTEMYERLSRLKLGRNEPRDMSFANPFFSPK